jgi:hypothetical protein
MRLLSHESISSLGLNIISETREATWLNQLSVRLKVFQLIETVLRTLFLIAPL